MSNIRTCFISLPFAQIDTKFTVDDVYELLLMPALEKFDLQIIRADKILNNQSITNNILDLIQTADLCIFDLSGHNSNVYYECGRRHETGRPYLHIAQKGTIIPFDIIGVRTIIYDLSDARVTRNSVIDLQESIAAQYKLGFEGASTTASLHAINERLARIEKALENSGVNVGAASSSLSFMDPRRAFQEAFAAGDLPKVVSLLPRLKETVGNSETLIAAAGVVANAGVSEGADLLRQIAIESWDQLTPKELRGILGGLVNYYSSRDMEEEGLPVVSGFVEKAIATKELTSTEKSSILNQLQRIAYGAKMYEQALLGANEVISLNPEESAYFYNRSLIYEKLNRLEEAAADVDMYMQMEPDEDHLAQAAEIYSKVGRKEESYTIVKKLREMGSSRAELVLKTLERS